MKKIKWGFILANLCVSSYAAAAGLDVSTRDAVEDGSIYRVASHDTWQTLCERDKGQQDSCFATVEVSGPIPLTVAIFSYPIEKNSVKADVDVVSVGGLLITPIEGGKIDKTLYVGMMSVNGKPFDGYLCKLADSSDCLREPELEKSNWNRLIESKTAEISILRKYPKKLAKGAPAAVENFEMEILHTTRVDTRGLRRANSAAEMQMAKLYDIANYSLPASTQSCVADINNQRRLITYVEDHPASTKKMSFRESIFGAKGTGSCPSYVSLAYLTPNITRSQRDLFCLSYDKKGDTYVGVAQGPRDAYNVCKKPSKAFCEYVESGKDKAVALASLATGAVAGAIGSTAVTGTTVVTHSSGAAILTGSAGYVAGTLGTAGATALGIATTPVTAAAVSVSVIALGSALYVCK